MTRLRVGIVDYGVGNHGSLRHLLDSLGFRCLVSQNSAVLATADIFLLPGVGAFQPAMAALRARGLDRLIKSHLAGGHPLLGICLGMQLLAESSTESGYCEGLGLLDGTVERIESGRHHIGWNEVRTAGEDGLFGQSTEECLYFNHSYKYAGPVENLALVSDYEGESIAAAVHRGKIAGVQFHPEKSQAAGKALLRRVIQGLCHA